MFLLFAVCVCFVLGCFDPFNNHEDKIKGNGNRALGLVFCFNIIIHLFFCFFLFVDLLRFSTRNRIGIPSFNIGVICVLAIKTITLFNYNFFGKKNIIDISSLLHISCLW